MPRNRSAAIVIHDHAVLVMFRKNTKEYFVFPGGGIEAGETNEQAAVREMKEETSVDIDLGKQIYELHYDNGDTHYYYLGVYRAGVPTLQIDTNEYRDNQRGDDFYMPQWLPLEELRHRTLYPLEVRDQLMNDVENGFTDSIIHFELSTPS